MKEKYKYIKNLLSLDVAEFITFTSLTFYLNDKKVDKIDDQVPLSFSMHSSYYPLYRHLLYFLKPRLEKESQLELNPIYSYSRFYLTGANLVKHTDRPACEISVSLTLKYKYKNKNYKWPLCMENTPIIIEPGDGVLYKGREIEHWRPIFTEPDGSCHHQVFLHYVNKNGPCKNLKEEVDNKTQRFNNKEQKKINNY
jgi:hypothetical protein